MVLSYSIAERTNVSSHISRQRGATVLQRNTSIPFASAL